MSHYYTSDEYHPSTRHILPGSSGALHLPTSCGKYSYPSKYSVDSSDRHTSSSLGNTHGNYSSHKYDTAMSSLTDKYADLNVAHWPNYSTELLLEQNTSLVSLGSSDSRGHYDLDHSQTTPHRKARDVKGKSEQVGKHNKIKFDMTNGAHSGELPPKSPSRRSKKYKSEKKAGSSPKESHGQKNQVVVSNVVNGVENGVDRDDEEDEEGELKEGIHCCETARWIGCGRVPGSCILTADRGYLIWNRPKGKLEVVIRYGDTGEDFSCFMDPQFRGVKVIRDRLNGKFEEILDGKENPKSSSNRHHRRSACRNRPENNFEFDSKNGEVKFILETLEGSQRKIPVFKINYTLAL